MAADDEQETLDRHLMITHIIIIVDVNIIYILQVDLLVLDAYFVPPQQQLPTHLDFLMCLYILLLKNL